MVHLLTVGGAFEAKVLAARLGSEGIVVTLQGGVDGPYPVGDVGVFVDADGFELARRLVLADEVEAAFVRSSSDGRRVPPLAALVLLAVLVCTVAGSIARLATL